jgi:hypothetical protein
VGNTLRDSEDALLKKIKVANYRQDPYYAPIVTVVEDLLREKGFVAPVELFIRMNLLSPESAEDWRRGQISYLERVIRCNLSKASRILRILRMHAHDLDLKPSLTVYKRWAKGSRPLRRFSKTGDHNIEEAYARHFVSPRKKGCPFEAGAIDVCNSAEISQARGPARDEKFRKAKSRGHASRRGQRLPMQKAGKQLQRCCIDESLIHDGHMWSVA